MRLRLFLPLVALLSACHSAPSQFYLLAAEPAAGHVAAAGGTTVALGRVNLPEALDRPQLARRVGPNRVDYAENERWAEPLDSMVRRVLAEDLATRLPPGMSLVNADSATHPALTVSVDVERFDADAAGRVTLAARWQKWGPNAALGSPRSRTIIEGGSGAAAAAVAATMSHALALLAADIAASLR